MPADTEYIASYHVVSLRVGDLQEIYTAADTHE